ncbi:hypothetical protein COY07_00720 [Candidatus Peregrinibacteria bacterium CG_4_10_14_0_2_um_filter_43_11]|nr:MAG: hypothetical protein COY07_00720 [Candidatus Peregrinibacteria bacterium CG_4_10_14_0_2_um_filter_43_11]
MAKNVLFIPSYIEGKHVYASLIKLHDLGYTLYSLCDRELNHPVDIFEEQFICDITKITDTMEFLKKQNIHFDAVFTNSVELVTPLIALLAKHYGFVGNDPGTAFHCRSKYHMRKKLQAEKIPVPGFRLCKNYQDVEKAVTEIGIPCVLKPVGWHSSFGTFMIRDKKDLGKLKMNYENSIQFLMKQISEISPFTKEELELLEIDDEVNMVTDYLVEEYMDGPEITIDAVVQNGKAYILGIQEQIIMPPPYFVRIGGCMPCQHSDNTQKEIQDLIQKTVEAIGIHDSATHTEIIFTKDGPRIVEIACRSGSDDLHEAIYHVSGYSTVYESVMIALGIKREYDFNPKCYVAMSYLLPDRKGKITKIEIPERVTKDPDVIELRMTKNIGSVVAPPPIGFDYMGFISVKGDTEEQAQKKLRDASDHIKITIADE